MTIPNKRPRKPTKELDEIARLLRDVENVDDEDLAALLLDAKDEYILRLIFNKKKELVN